MPRQIDQRDGVAVIRHPRRELPPDAAVSGAAASIADLAELVYPHSAARRRVVQREPVGRCRPVVVGGDQIPGVGGAFLKDASVKLDPPMIGGGKHQ
ncbi:MAG: hypothetical protein LBE08_09765, partial [Bifidobacteriaceae bacterium]|nr:hypothetical protein [Bifidobacteriaceae bacterium]